MTTLGSSFNYVATAQKPTNVTHSLVASFTSPDALNLIVARCTRIEIYALEAQGLVLLHDVPLYCRVATMELWKPGNRATEQIFISTERYHAMLHTVRPANQDDRYFLCATLREDLQINPDPCNDVFQILDHDLDLFTHANQSLGCSPSIRMVTIDNISLSDFDSADSARRALQDREVGNLQRRIQKLNDTLAATEQRLASATSSKKVESGISSIYREVQGLDESDAQAGKKKELMADIFRANLKLQKRSRGA